MVGRRHRDQIDADSRHTDIAETRAAMHPVERHSSDRRRIEERMADSEAAVTVLYEVLWSR